MNKILETKENKKSFLLGVLVTSGLFLSLIYIVPIIKSYETDPIECLVAPCPSPSNMTMNQYIKNSKSYIKFLREDKSNTEERYYELEKSIKK